MYGMDGYWVKRYITGRVGMVLKVINVYDIYALEVWESCCTTNNNSRSVRCGIVLKWTFLMRSLS